MDKRYQVFVSSTYEDLREERGAVMQALLGLDCIPTGMESFPAKRLESALSAGDVEVTACEGFRKPAPGRC